MKRRQHGLVFGNFGQFWLYWPIFNLDLKNPYAHEEETLDPDELLIKYKNLLGEIEETENQLKSELAAALSHHFNDEEA